VYTRRGMPHDAEEVLDEEGQVEADDHQPEVHLAEALESRRPLIFGNQ
jgi:hypothetical protein